VSAMAGLPVPAGGTRRALMFSGVRRALGRSVAVRAGGGLLILIIGACVLVPFFWPDSPSAFVTAPFAPPGLAHPFGSDDLGRDVFVRTLAGGRVDIAVAAAVVAVSCTAGTIIGACAGASRRRWASLTVARVVDAFIAFPYLVTILVLPLVWLLRPPRTAVSTPLEIREVG